MNKDARHRVEDLVPFVKKAFTSLPGYKVLQAFEMRKDVAAEAIEDGGWCRVRGRT